MPTLESEWASYRDDVLRPLMAEPRDKELLGAMEPMLKNAFFAGAASAGMIPVPELIAQIEAHLASL